MATYTMQILLSNGQTLNAYFGANQAVGTYLPVDLSGPAAATSPQDFEVASRASIVDVVTDQTSGMVEFISKGQPTGRFLNTDARYANSITNRRPPVVTLVPGRRYRLKMAVAGAA